jgi:hypothetical protein
MPPRLPRAARLTPSLVITSIFAVNAAIGKCECEDMYMVSHNNTRDLRWIQKRPRSAGPRGYVKTHSWRGSAFLKSAGTTNRSALTAAVDTDTNSEDMVMSWVGAFLH